MPESIETEVKIMDFRKNREKWGLNSELRKNREKSRVLSLSGESRVRGLKIGRIPTKLGELTGMRDAFRLHNACFDNLLNCGHYHIMVANNDPISIRRCEQHPMIGKREIGQKAEDLGRKAVGGRCTQKAVDFRLKR